LLLKQAIKGFTKYMQLIDRSQETIRGYAIELKSFSNFVTVKHNCPVYMEDITLQDLEDYLLHEKERGSASASRSRSLYILRSFYNYCCKKDLCTKNIASLLEPVKIKQKERAFITEGEFEQLAATIEQPVIRTVIQAMFYTGGRISEMINLKLEDVDLENKILHIIDGKGGKDRDVPINDKLHKILIHYLKNIREADSDRFFSLTRTGKVSAPAFLWLQPTGKRSLGSQHPKTPGTLKSRYLHQDTDKLSEAVNLL